ncbi:MAG: type II toxin-antitoxin system VapC family toxin [Acidobacteriota bacterium]
MILIDTNIFVDIWTDDPQWSDWSSTALAKVATSSRLAINPIIYAELSIGFELEQDLDDTLRDADVRCLALPCRAAWPAARAFTEYRARGGSRQTPLPDFFIGAHAEAEGLNLLTRDVSRYRTYFPSVELVAPSH